MGNPYFKFKQFTIRQDHCAMKVSTDACVFGAWLASLKLPVTHTLDIGCGTGLLMAMLAQQWDGRFTGIDIDEKAALQASANLADTPWGGRLAVVHGDVRTYPFRHAYDCIVSNPPFYERQLTSDDGRVNLARHSSELTLEALMTAIHANLAPGGHAAILLPFDRAAEWNGLAIRHGLWLRHRMDLRQTPRHGFFRSCMLFREGQAGEAILGEMTIQNGRGAYTEEAVALLHPYYLYLQG
jgi:tRNA1Val (adenine37-N6)-methyltransferase